MHTENAMRAVYTILMVVIGFVILVPVLALVFGSFWSSSPVAAGHVTLDNWIRALNISIPTDLPTLVFNSLVFAFVMAAISVVLGVAMAFLVVRTDMPYGNVFAKLGIVPRAFPVIIAALAWILLLSPRIGVLNVLCREIFGTFPTDEVAGLLHLTLDDDNVGVMPQITISAVHELVKELRKGWAGFSARERFPADHDWVLAYLSRAGWDAEATPDTVAADFLQGVCGQACGEALLEAFREVEAATTAFEQSDYGFGFPVPQLMMKHWRRPGPIPEYLSQVRDHYRRGLEASRRAYQQATDWHLERPAL